MSAPDGLADPGQMPTTTQRTILDDPALRAALERVGQLRTAVADAREIFDEIEPLLDGHDGPAEAVERWQERYRALADPPLEVEVEEDDDSTEEPEGALWEREEGD